MRANRQVEGLSTELGQLENEVRHLKRKLRSEQDQNHLTQLEGEIASAELRHFYHPRIYLIKGMLYERLYEYDRAAIAYNYALKMAPDDTRTLLYKARFLLMIGRFDQASTIVSDLFRRQDELTEKRKMALIRLKTDLMLNLNQALEQATRPSCSTASIMRVTNPEREPRTEHRSSDAKRQPLTYLRVPAPKGSQLENANMAVAPQWVRKAR